ncbi:MAG: HEPN domain-containing protein [Bryobacteraceae bacterium]
MPEGALGWHQVEFPKTHDIAKLLDGVATVNAQLADSLRDADMLTPFGVEVRYPSDAPELLEGAEIEAVEIARRLKDVIMISLQPYLDGG